MDFVLLFKAIIIAIIEGITEFIPISSTGHMIIAGDVLDFTGNFANLFTVVIQLGAIFAILVLYKQKIFSTILGVFKLKRDSIRFWTNIMIGCVPAAVLGLYFEDIIDEYLFNTFTVALALIIGAILMLLSEEYFRRKEKTRDVDYITFPQAFSVGVFQCLALWPGMSRSASTIIGGWISGLSTVVATEFSFFLAIPVMVGASGLKLVKHGSVLNKGEIIVLIIGFVVAFLSALVCVERFIDYLKKKPMKNFAYYRIILGLALLIFVSFR
ncbi:undecaprenyl-diphosphate phosphatase [uncultured Clostridium sp.]|uniref:undecaprenyl-diphosphate phosphatase n=1 Tax=uncultured Clostridium sp. TaxID=59620 RepID=UPI0032172DA7